MAGFSDYFAKASLALLVGKTAFTLPTVYVALFTAVGTDAGTGFTEVSGGGYARVATSGATWNAPTDTDPPAINNAAMVTFPTATASWGAVIAFGLYDAVTGGNLLQWDFLGNDPWFPFTATLASPGVLTAPGITAGSPAFANGSTVVVSDEWFGALPTGLIRFSQYTVAGLASDTFNLGQNTTSVGSGAVRQVSPQEIPTNVTFGFPAGNLTLSVS